GDLALESRVGRAVDFARLGPSQASIPPRPASLRAESLRCEASFEFDSAHTTSTPSLSSCRTTAMGIERGGAVRAHDAEVVDPVVVADAADVIEDETHCASIPFLVLAAHFAAPSFDAFDKETLLQVPPVVARPFDEDG